LPFLLVSLSFAMQRQRDEWVTLFDGKTLNGWSIHGGFAKYQVESGNSLALPTNGIQTAPQTS